ncbi:MAG: hypothetical protein V3W19_18655 [Desulfatiglandales bacterium]
MSIEKETIAFLWMGGIGLTSLLSSWMLISKRTEDWSEKKIVSVSGVASLVIMAIVLLLT